MKTRRHHNNHSLTSTKRGKRKAEVERIAHNLGIVQDRYQKCDHYFQDSKCCLKCGWQPKPKKDDILERPEEEPGYGHGI